MKRARLTIVITVAAVSLMACSGGSNEASPEELLSEPLDLAFVTETAEEIVVMGLTTSGELLALAAVPFAPPNGAVHLQPLALSANGQRVLLSRRHQSGWQLGDLGVGSGPVAWGPQWPYQLFATQAFGVAAVALDDGTRLRVDLFDDAGRRTVIDDLIDSGSPRISWVGLFRLDDRLGVLVPGRQAYRADAAGVFEPWDLPGGIADSVVIESAPDGQVLCVSGQDGVRLVDNSDETHLGGPGTCRFFTHGSRVAVHDAAGTRIYTREGLLVRDLAGVRFLGDENGAWLGLDGTRLLRVELDTEPTEIATLDVDPTPSVDWGGGLSWFESPSGGFLLSTIFGVDSVRVQGWLIAFAGARVTPVLNVDAINLAVVRFDDSLLVSTVPFGGVDVPGVTDRLAGMRSDGTLATWDPFPDTDQPIRRAVGRAL